ncbi:hypothetical protein SEVIR_1G126051v4 [Setaria viridis]
MLILPLALLPGTLASGGAGRGGAAPESQSSPASSTVRFLFTAIRISKVDWTDGRLVSPTKEWPDGPSAHCTLGWQAGAVTLSVRHRPLLPVPPPRRRLGQKTQIHFTTISRRRPCRSRPHPVPITSPPESPPLSRPTASRRLAFPRAVPACSPQVRETGYPNPSILGSAVEEHWGRERGSHQPS